ncbi:hypothetical protein ACFTWD_34625, partial [Streptomyces sp. NPDC056943]|uniref:hypothetical protein n=1 Tax=Streptomyces sp. NPDC056943 TaxID=3345971 RepID=UPI00362C0BE8
LALIFGTLLSSQGADASFVLTLAGFPPGFSFGLFLRSCVSDSIRSFRSDFLGAFRSLLFSLRGPFGGSDFIRIISADLIGGFRDSNENRDDSVEKNSRPE